MDGEEAKQNLITFWDHLRHGFGSGRDVTSQFCCDVTTEPCRSLGGAYKRISFSYRHFLWRAQLQRNFRCGSGIFVLSRLGLFIFRTPSEVKLVISREEKTFTDNICDELRKRRLSLKINPDDQISMWIHAMVYDFYLYANSSLVGQKNVWRSLNLEVNCVVSCHPKNEWDAQCRTTGRTNVRKSWCHWEEPRERTAVYVWKLLHVK